MNRIPHKVFRLVLRRMSLVVALAASMISIAAFVTPLLSKDLMPFVLGITASVLGAVLAAALATSMKLISSRTRVFISYTHSDTDFVMKLVSGLQDLNIEPLIDRFELNVGDDIRTAVDDMIDRADCFLFVVSEASAKSDWAKKELEQAMERKKRVLPVLLSVEALPDALSGVFYADFTGEFELGLHQLKKTFEKGGVQQSRGHVRR